MRPANTGKASNLFFAVVIFVALFCVETLLRAQGYERVNPQDYFGNTHEELAICIGSANGRGCIAMYGDYQIPTGTVITTGNIIGFRREQDAVLLHLPGMPEECCWYMPSTFAPGRDFVKHRDKLRGRWPESTIFGWNVIISQQNFQESVNLVERHQLWPRCFAKLDAEPSGGKQVESPKIECSFMHDTENWMQQTIPSIRACPKMGGPYNFTGKDFVCINWWDSPATYW